MKYLTHVLSPQKWNQINLLFNYLTPIHVLPSIHFLYCLSYASLGELVPISCNHILWKISILGNLVQKYDKFKAKSWKVILVIFWQQLFLRNSESSFFPFYIESNYNKLYRFWTCPELKPQIGMSHSFLILFSLHAKERLMRPQSRIMLSTA